MQLFTKTDLERCARLAVDFYNGGCCEGDEVRVDRAEGELAISRAVAQIVDETDPVYTEEQVVRAVKRALETL